MNKIKHLILKAAVLSVSSIFLMTANAQPAFNTQSMMNSTNFGSEFITYSCPSNYTLNKDNKTCNKIETSTYSLSCNTGYTYNESNKICSKVLTSSINYSCPSGYNRNSTSCTKTLTEKKYQIGKSYPYHGESTNNASYVFDGTYHSDRRYGSYWQGVKKFSYPVSTKWVNHSDGWKYKKGGYKQGGGGNGGGWGRFEITRQKTLTQAVAKSCTSGYALLGNQCRKTVTSVANKYCRSGVLKNNRCEIVNNIAAIKNDPIGKLIKSLYYNQGKQADAAFRYLDLMYTQDTISERLSNNQFASLWGNNERKLASDAINFLSEKITQSSDLTYLKQLLLDVYYDRAVAESILANQDIDQARIEWLVNDNASITSNIALRKAAAQRLETALNDYWKLIKNNPKSIKTLTSQRGLNSPRYIDSNGNSQQVANDKLLFEGYKDIAMLYTIMNMLAEQKLAVAKLTFQSGETNPSIIIGIQTDLETLTNVLATKDSVLKTLFGEQALQTAATSSGLPESMIKLDTNLSALRSAKRWLNGETNLLGLPQDSVLLIQGYGIDGNTVFDSFDALMSMIARPLDHAKTVRLTAANKYTSYNHNRDLFRNNYQATQRLLDNQLYNLLGCTYSPNTAESCIADNAQRAGSQVSQQYLLITTAQQNITRAQQQRQNISDAILIEEERLAIEKGINQALEKVVIQFGQQQLQLQQFLSENDASSTFNPSDFKAQLKILSDFINDNGLVKLEDVLAASNDFESTIKGMNLKDTKNHASVLAGLERASLISTERGLLDNTSRARIRGLLLEAKTAELDIAHSLTVFQYETERLAGMLNQAKRIKAQLKTHQAEQLDRFYADPLHFTRLTTEALKAEQAFTTLQEWLFYTVSALEYKLQEPFHDRSNGFNKASLFNLYTLNELEQYYQSLVDFNDTRNVLSTQQAIDTFSLKKHVFGYNDTIHGKMQWYPSPTGTGEMLTSEEAFKAKLGTMTRRFGSDTWLTIEFSTMKEIPRSNFFQGPVVASNDDISCLADAGTYLDKIESIAINLPTSYTVSNESDTPAYLTYGGNSYLRSKVPGDISEDQSSVNNEILIYSTRFWDYSSNGQLNFTNSFRQQMAANITQTDTPSLEMRNSTYSFKERSVAASGWRLSIKLADRAGDIVELDALDDIELLFKHRFKSRNFQTCDNNNGGPLLLLLK